MQKYPLYSVIGSQLYLTSTFLRTSQQVRELIMTFSE